MAQSWSDSVDIQQYSPCDGGFAQRTTSTSDDPCSLARITTMMRVPSLGALVMDRHCSGSGAGIGLPHFGASSFLRRIIHVQNDDNNKIRELGSKPRANLRPQFEESSPGCACSTWAFVISARTWLAKAVG